MKQLYITLVAVLCCAMPMTMLTSCTSDNDENPAEQIEVNPDDKTEYTVKNLPVIRDGKADGIIAIRFYKDLPSVPYISVSDFQRLMLPGSTVTVTMTGTGTYQLVNQGSTATVNTVDETFAVADYMSFTNLMGLLQQGMDNAYMDGLPCVRYSHQTLTGGSSSVTFNFSKYGINLRGDETNVYFPFTTLADLYADLHYHNAACNGENVCVASVDNSSEGIGSFAPEYQIEKLKEKGTRAEDMIAYAYGELCFTVDHFYGMPGRSPYEASIRQIGFDKTLEASDDGKLIKQLLLSADMDKYGLGIEMLMLYLNDGGHTKTWPDRESIMYATDLSGVQDYVGLIKRYFNEYFSVRVGKSVRYNLLKGSRNKIYGDNLTYHKKGNTAICHFDGFGAINYEAWRNFYNGTGPLPTLENTQNDNLVVFLDALKKASEDPEVKNLVIDLTQNMGGSLDVVVAMTSLMYGESLCRCENTLTGQHVTWYYDVDRNFDGKFDEKDKDVHYDLNFCVLTSDFSFSCGNLFPSLCKDAGVLVAGQTSGGGACAVGMFRTAEGFLYQLSSCRGRLTDNKCVTLNTGSELTGEWSGITYTQYGLEPFYDIDILSQIMSSYYPQ